MKRHPAIIEALDKKVGMDGTTPDGASRLRNDIESATGEHLSLNTVVREVTVPAPVPEPDPLDVLNRRLMTMCVLIIARM